MLHLTSNGSLINCIIYIYLLLKKMPYKEDNSFLRNYQRYPDNKFKQLPNAEQLLLQYILKNAQKGDPIDVLNSIDKFCQMSWMMNAGADKGIILIEKLKQWKPKSILQIGCYCGYSSLLMATYSEAIIKTFEVNPFVASIARQIHAHAGLQNRIVVHNNPIQVQLGLLKQHGKFDMMFFDHHKGYYLSDLIELQKIGAIDKGSVVIGDNIIRPGVPDYLQHMKVSHDYDSILYHSYLEYSDEKDGLLVSYKLN